MKRDNRVFPLPRLDCLVERLHGDAINGAGRQAEFAAGALLGNDGVHLFRCSDNRVDRAGLNAQCASDTGLLINEGNGFGLLDPVFGR